MRMMIAVAIGGALGAMSRYAISSQIARTLGTGFPWGTLTVNLIGSFLMGLLAPVLLSKVSSPEIRSFLTVGLLGSLTTFSTFSMETVALYQRGEAGLAALNVGVSVAACIAGLMVGLQAGKVFS